MTSFRFNFCNGENDQINENTEKESIHWLKSEEVRIEGHIKDIDDVVKHAKLFICGDIEIGHVTVSDAIAHMDKQTISKIAEDSHSDLITGKYEGGLKIWECTSDLIEYLTENKETINWASSRVLDLGCGAGILGILTLMNHSFVTFQDYNKEVIKWVTIPNVLLNIEEEERSEEIKKCKFYSGDWESFDKLLPDIERYDYILTSETIYNPDNYTKITNILFNRLNTNGIAFVAAKTHYFGVGGGTRQFKTYLEKSNKFNIEICWSSKGGIQREILKVSKKSQE